MSTPDYMFFEQESGFQYQLHLAANGTDARVTLPGDHLDDDRYAVPLPSTPEQGDQLIALLRGQTRGRLRRAAQLLSDARAGWPIILHGENGDWELFERWAIDRLLSSRTHFAGQWAHPERDAVHRMRCTATSYELEIQLQLTPQRWHELAQRCLAGALQVDPGLTVEHLLERVAAHPEADVLFGRWTLMHVCTDDLWQALWFLGPPVEENPAEAQALATLRNRAMCALQDVLYAGQPSGLIS